MISVASWVSRIVLEVTEADFDRPADFVYVKGKACRKSLATRTIGFRGFMIAAWVAWARPDAPNSS